MFRIREVKDLNPFSLSAMSEIFRWGDSLIAVVFKLALGLTVHGHRGLRPKMFRIRNVKLISKRSRIHRALPPNVFIVLCNNHGIYYVKFEILSIEDENCKAVNQ